MASSSNDVIKKLGLDGQFFLNFELIAATAQTPIELITDAEVKSNRAIYLHGYQFRNGKNAWGTAAAEIKVTTNDEAVEILNIDSTQITSQRRCLNGIYQGGTVAAIAFDGLFLAGLQGQGMKIAADENEPTGSNIQFAIWGRFVEVV